MREPQVVEGAENFALGDGPVAALLVHGFQGSPQGLRDLGGYLAERGITVAAPRLPGHGTTWQYLNTRKPEEWVAAVEDAYEGLAAGRREVFLVGLSFGAALCLDFAARNPEKVRGLVTLAGYVYTDDPLRIFAPLVTRFVKSIPARSNDIADPSVREIATDRFPATSGWEATKLATKTVRRGLGKVVAPILVIHGRNDHTVPLRSSEIIFNEVGSKDKELVVLERSYHVITLDYEKDLVFERTYDFIKEHSEVIGE